MNEIEAILAVKEVLVEKTNLFARYEALTGELLSCEPDDMVEIIEQRQDIAEEIDVFDQKLNGIYELSGNDNIKNAAINKLAFGECPNQLEDIFLTGQKMFSIISSIMLKEEQATARAKELREKLLEQIKEQNSGEASKVAKYYSSSKNLGQNFSLFDNKY